REFFTIERHAFAALLDDRELAQLDAFEGGEAGAARGTEATPSYGGVVVGRSRIFHLRIVMTAERTAHLLESPPPLPGSHRPVVDPKPSAQLAHLGAHRGLDGVVFLRIGAQPIEHLADQFADAAEFRCAEAAR